MLWVAVDEYLHVLDFWNLQHISDIFYLSVSVAWESIGGVKMNAIEMQNEQAEDPIQSPCGFNLQFN